VYNKEQNENITDFNGYPETDTEAVGPGSDNVELYRGGQSGVTTLDEGWLGSRGPIKLFYNYSKLLEKNKKIILGFENDIALTLKQLEQHSEAYATKDVRTDSYSYANTKDPDDINEDLGSLADYESTTALENHDIPVDAEDFDEDDDEEE
jgi:hypothetical protein